MLLCPLPVAADVCQLPPFLVAAYLGTSSPTSRTLSSFVYLAPVAMCRALEKP